MSLWHNWCIIRLVVWYPRTTSRTACVFGTVWSLLISFAPYVICVVHRKLFLFIPRHDSRFNGWSHLADGQVPEIGRQLPAPWGKIAFNKWAIGNLVWDFQTCIKMPKVFKVKHWKICSHGKISHGQRRFQLIWRCRTFAYLGYASLWNAMRLPSQLHGMKWRKRASWINKAR